MVDAISRQRRKLRTRAVPLMAGLVAAVLTPQIASPVSLAENVERGTSEPSTEANEALWVTYKNSNANHDQLYSSGGIQAITGGYARVRGGTAWANAWVYSDPVSGSQYVSGGTGPETRMTHPAVVGQSLCKWTLMNGSFPLHCQYQNNAPTLKRYRASDAVMAEAVEQLEFLDGERVQADALPPFVDATTLSIDQASVRVVGVEPNGIGHWVGVQADGEICLISVLPRPDWVASQTCAPPSRFAQSGLTLLVGNGESGVRSRSHLVPDGYELDGEVSGQLNVIGPNLATSAPRHDLPAEISVPSSGQRSEGLSLKTLPHD